jgi:AcrR family transcriptional regulator
LLPSSVDTRVTHAQLRANSLSDSRYIDICSHLIYIFSATKTRLKQRTVRRQPKQRRARITVEAVLDSVAKVLKRDGVDAITTNHIAEVAGVSIGSIYQYFPDKRAIFAALHRRHVEEIDRLIENTLIEHATSSLEDLMRAMVEAMVDAHTGDPELYQVMMTLVPHGVDGTRAFPVRLHNAFRLAIASRQRELKRRKDLDKVVFVVANMVDALSHGAVLRRPEGVSLAAAKQEAVRAVLAYLRA